jgi:hypothetical protein
MNKMTTMTFISLMTQNIELNKSSDKLKTAY